MNRQELERVADRVREPMTVFVREARVRTAILLNRSGQVLAQHGFSRRYDMVSVASLAAATHASAHALAELTGAGRWLHLHHAGEQTQLFLAPFGVNDEELVLVAIFDHDSTLGLVQLFFDRLVEALAEIDELRNRLPATDAAEFERELEAGLDRVLAADDG
jgi:predicted regulator of Ras-like GTPase activity (Roadblock/LC7/MglB family)